MKLQEKLWNKIKNILKHIVTILVQLNFLIGDI